MPVPSGVNLRGMRGRGRAIVARPWENRSGLIREFLRHSRPLDWWRHRLSRLDVVAGRNVYPAFNLRHEGRLLFEVSTQPRSNIGENQMTGGERLFRLLCAMVIAAGALLPAGCQLFQSSAPTTEEQKRNQTVSDFVGSERMGM